MVLMLASILTPKSDAAAATTAGPKIPAKPKLNVVVIGDFYSYGYATSSVAALRNSAPPTLQVLNQVQAADRGVQVNVLFIPVTAATSGALFDSENQAKMPALIDAVAHSSVVIVGIGGGNAALAGPMRSVLFGTAASAKAFPQLMTSFDDGYYLAAQTVLLDAIAAHAASGTSIVTLGYPTTQGRQLSSGFTWWSPYTGSTVSEQQANMSDQLVSALDTANEQATSIAAAAHSGLHFLYADLSNAMQGTGPSSSQGQGGPAQTAIGNGLLPYISQAVNNELVTMNVHGTQDIPPVTPAPHWKLNVALPVSAPATPRHTNPAGVSPLQNNQGNPASPVYQIPAWPGFPASPPSANSGSTVFRPHASPVEGVSIPTVQSGGSGHGRQGEHGRSYSPPANSESGQPPGTAERTPTGRATPQPTGNSKPAPGGQATTSPPPARPRPQPTASRSPSGGASTGNSGGNTNIPSSSATTAPPGQATVVPAPAPAGTWDGGGLSSSPSSSSTTTSTTPSSPSRPATLPTIPAPPAPLPEPITPASDAPGGLSTDPNSTGATPAGNTSAGNTSAGTNAPGTPTGLGADS
jgi:hypothetical protein